MLAIGKAAHGMARVAVDALAARGATLAGGIVVAHHDAPLPAASLQAATGDHPIPGVRSVRAADLLGDAVRAVGPLDLVVVLLSGGASSLIGAPVTPGLTPDDIAATSRTLLAAGVPIELVNTVRKRVSRWGAGRLAQALAPARVLCLAVSDVPGDDPAVIGSGPCAPDPWTATALREALTPRGVWSALPDAVRVLVDRIADLAAIDPDAETAKPGGLCFAGVRTLVIRSNADARAAAAAAARLAGWDVVSHEGWLSGGAAPLGRALAQAVLASRPGTAHVWGGEPTVRLDGAPNARGGRMQELALAAADALHDAGARAHDIALLAAGTDGRDGPTDAAGALVDSATWAAIRAAGREPAADLAAHQSYDALGAAGALLPAIPTGTNVADVVIALRAP